MKPTWTQYFLGLALLVAQRSHDVHTKHGCIITDKSNRILGVGYNGFPRGLSDTDLPTSRPEKYDWMIHAERNALANCVIRPENAIAYVTGQCCNSCIMSLYQEGVSKVVMAKSHGTLLFDNKQQEIFDTFIKMSSLEIEYEDIDFSWLRSIIGVL